MKRKKKIIILIVSLVMFLTGVGLVISGVALADESILSGTSEKKITEKAEDIKVIEIDALASSVEIARSPDENIHVSYYNSFFCKYEQSVKDGTLTIEAKDVIPHISLGTVTSSRVVVSLPDGFEGDIDAKFDVGEFKMKDITVNGSVKTETDAGRIVFENCKINLLDASSDVGTIEFNNLDCMRIICESDVGSVKGTLCGKKEDYKIDCQTELGACNIQNSNTGDRELKISTDIGTIKIDFES